MNPPRKYRGFTLSFWQRRLLRSDQMPQPSLCWRILVALFLSVLETLLSYSLFWVKESNFSPLWKMLWRFSLTPLAISSNSTSILLSFLSDSPSALFCSSSSYDNLCAGFTWSMASLSFFVKLWVSLPISIRSSCTSYSTYSINLVKSALSSSC